MWFISSNFGSYLPVSLRRRNVTVVSQNRNQKSEVNDCQVRRKNAAGDICETSQFRLGDDDDLISSSEGWFLDILDPPMLARDVRRDGAFSRRTNDVERAVLRATHPGRRVIRHHQRCGRGRFIHHEAGIEAFPLLRGDERLQTKQSRKWRRRGGRRRRRTVLSRGTYFVTRAHHGVVPFRMHTHKLS